MEEIILQEVIIGFSVLNKENGVKKVLSIFGIIFLVFSIIGCDTGGGSGTVEQEYDMIQYVVNSSDWAKIQTQAEQMEAAIYPNEPTKADLNYLEQWIVLNTDAQVVPVRGVTWGEITEFFLEYTSISRTQLNTLFENVSSVGKTIQPVALQGGDVNIIFIEKL